MVRQALQCSIQKRRMLASGWLKVWLPSLSGCEKQLGLKSSPMPSPFAQSTQR
jgi:hypothetical protein